MFNDIELTKIKSNIKLNQIMKKLPNGKKVFDFNKVEKLGFFANVFITERGAKGKTFNMKEKIKDDFLKYNRESVWIGNTVIMTEKIQDDFLKDLKKQNAQKLMPKKSIDFWNNTITSGKVESNKGVVKYKNKNFIKLLSMNHAELMKGSRIPYKNIVIDEFNVKSNLIYNYTYKLDVIIQSINDVVSGVENDFKLYLFGNNKTINNPLLFDLGITSISHEITEYYYKNQKMILVVVPKFSKEDRIKFEEENKSNKTFLFSKIIGTDKHSYFNDNNDEINNVIQYTSDPINIKMLKPYITIIWNKEFINVYRIKDSNYFHCVIVKRNSVTPNIVAVTKKQIQENVIFRNGLKDNLLKLLQADKVTFENIRTRDIFIKALNN